MERANAAIDACRTMVGAKTGRIRELLGPIRYSRAYQITSIVLAALLVSSLVIMWVGRKRKH